MSHSFYFNQNAGLHLTVLNFTPSMCIARMMGRVVQLAICEMVCSLLILDAIQLYVLSAPLEFAGEYEDNWKYWKLSYNKHYSSVEEEMERYNMWRDNLLYIEEHNQEAEVHGFRLRMNAFGDQSHEDWTLLQKCHKINSYVNNSRHGKMYQPSTTKSLPIYFDWRKHNVVTTVKNQEEYRCHSCYAFAATGAIESAHAIKTGDLVSLSEQQILDCSRVYANAACRGGNCKFAWNYIIDNGGIDTSSSYPYRSEQGSCYFRKKTIGATISSMLFIKQGSETDLQTAVVQHGPVAVAIDHRHRSFQFYDDGIYREASCLSDARNLTHEMLVVGYGQDAYNQSYWIVKNSYGSNWGSNGYMYMMRNENMCGIATDAAFPVI